MKQSYVIFVSAVVASAMLMTFQARPVCAETGAQAGLSVNGAFLLIASALKGDRDAERRLSTDAERGIPAAEKGMAILYSMEESKGRLPKPEAVLLDSVDGNLSVNAALRMHEGKVVYCALMQQYHYPARFTDKTTSGKVAPGLLEQMHGTTFGILKDVRNLHLSYTVPGIVTLGCYRLSTNTVWVAPGSSAWLRVAEIVIVHMELVNTFPFRGRYGPTTAKSYHVNFLVRPIFGTISGLTGVTHKDTCIVWHDNAENRWEVDTCHPTPH